MIDSLHILDIFGTGYFIELLKPLIFNFLSQIYYLINSIPFIKYLNSCFLKMIYRIFQYFVIYFSLQLPFVLNLCFYLLIWNIGKKRVILLIHCSLNFYFCHNLLKWIYSAPSHAFFRTIFMSFF